MTRVEPLYTELRVAQKLSELNSPLLLSTLTRSNLVKGYVNRSPIGLAQLDRRRARVLATQVRIRDAGLLCSDDVLVIRNSHQFANHLNSHVRTQLRSELFRPAN